MYKQKYWHKYANSLATGIRYGSKYAPAVKAVMKAINNRQTVKASPQYRRYVKKNRVYKRRPYRGRRKSCSTKKLSKEVAKIKKQVSANTSTFIQKNRAFSSALVPNTTEVVYNTFSLNSLTNLESAIDAVKYFDPNTPGTLITVNLSTPTFQNQVRFTSCYAKAICRNNYSVPANVTIYVMSVKKDTGLAPTTVMTSSLADMSNTTITDPLIYPSDCHDFNDLWKITKSKSWLLSAGEECSLSHSMPSFNYDVSLSDAHNLFYQKGFHGSVFLVRVTGVLAHGSTSGHAQSKAGVDITYQRNYKINYPGGADIIYLESNDSPSAVVGTLQLSQLSNEQATYAL